MRRGRVAAALVVLVALCAPARADILVRIDQSAQQMTVVIDGAPAHHWSISTGRDGYRTPNGSFRAIRLERVYYSKKFDDAPMPNSVFFYGGYAIHGTMEEGKLGRPASHGCVRLARVNAETLFGLVRARGMSNTRIVVTGEARDWSAPMARGNDRPNLQRFKQASVRPSYRGFEDFGARGRRDERRVYAEPARERTGLVPGRTYSEAQMRAIYRQNGWRWQ